MAVMSQFAASGTEGLNDYPSNSCLVKICFHGVITYTAYSVRQYTPIHSVSKKTFAMFKIIRIKLNYIENQLSSVSQLSVNNEKGKIVQKYKL